MDAEMWHLEEALHYEVRYSNYWHSNYPTDCSLVNKSLKFSCKCIMKFLYSFDIMLCLLLCSFIFAEPYLSICMICSYQLFHIVLVFEFLYTLFYKHGVIFASVCFFSLKSCQWYAESIRLLYDTSNGVEENGGNISCLWG